MGVLTLVFGYFFEGGYLESSFWCQRYVGNMGKEIEKERGSRDLEVGSFSYLVVYLEREESKDFWRQRFFPSGFQALFFKNVV